MSTVCFEVTSNLSCSVCTTQSARHICTHDSSTHYLCTSCALKHISSQQDELHQISMVSSEGLGCAGLARGKSGAERDETIEKLKESLREIDNCIESVERTSELIVDMVHSRTNGQLQRLREFRSTLQYQISLGMKPPTPTDPLLQPLLQNQHFSPMDFSKRPKFVHCRTDFHSWPQQFADLLGSFTVLIEVEVEGVLPREASDPRADEPMSVLIVNSADINKSTGGTDMNGSNIEKTEPESRGNGLCCIRPKGKASNPLDSPLEKQNTVPKSYSLNTRQGKDLVAERFPYIKFGGKALIAILLLAAFGYCCVWATCSWPVVDSENSTYSALYPEGWYEGQRNAKGQRHGFGVQRYTNGGLVYTGLWANDKMHGLGALFAIDGTSVSNREFARGQLNDLRVPQPNGEVAFAGQWEHGLPASSCAVSVDYSLCYALFPQADSILYRLSNTTESDFWPQAHRDGLWESIVLRSTRDIILTGISISGSGPGANLTLVYMEITSSGNYTPAGLFYAHSTEVDLTSAASSVEIELTSAMRVPENTPILIRALLEGGALWGNYSYPASQDGLNVIVEGNGSQPPSAGVFRGIYYRY